MATRNGNCDALQLEANRRHTQSLWAIFSQICTSYAQKNAISQLPIKLLRPSLDSATLFPTWHEYLTIDGHLLAFLPYFHCECAETAIFGLMSTYSDITIRLGA